MSHLHPFGTIQRSHTASDLWDGLGSLRVTSESTWPPTAVYRRGGDPTASHVERCWKRVACPDFSLNQLALVQIGVKVVKQQGCFPCASSDPFILGLRLFNVDISALISRPYQRTNSVGSFAGMWCSMFQLIIARNRHITLVLGGDHLMATWWGGAATRWCKRTLCNGWSSFCILLMSPTRWNPSQFGMPRVQDSKIPESREQKGVSKIFPGKMGPNWQKKVLHLLWGRGCCSWFFVVGIISGYHHDDIVYIVCRGSLWIFSTLRRYMIKESR